MCVYHLKWLTSARPRWPWTGSLFSKPHLNLVGLFMPILEIFLRNKYGKGTRAVWLELLVSSANTCSCVKYVSAIFNIFRDQLMCKDNPHIMVSHPPALVVGSFLKARLNRFDLFSGCLLQTLFCHFICKNC